MLYRKLWKTWIVLFVGFALWAYILHFERQRGYQAFIKQTGNTKNLTFEEWNSLQSKIIIISNKD